MPTSSDYIPAKDIDFDTWLNNFSTLLTAAPTDYGLVAGDATAVAGVTTTWNAAWALVANPATKTAPAVADKDAARASAEALVRPYAVSISLNPGVSDMNKASIGVTVRKVVPTPIPPPTTTPTLALVSAAPLTHALSYKDTSTPTTKSKPFGAIGIQVFRAIGTVPAVDPAQAVYYNQWTKSPNVSSFSSGDVGKTCTYFARWITRGGPGGAVQAGPFSAPLALTIM